MGIFDSVTESKEKKKSNSEKLVNLLTERDHTLSIVEPATSGLITYRIRRHEFTKDVVDAGYIPSSYSAYEDFIELDKVGTSFPSQKVSNQHDAQLIAINVRERLESDGGLSVLTSRHSGPAERTLYVGLNYHDHQVVFTEDLDFSQDDIKKKISEYVIKNALSEIRMNTGN